MQYGTRWGQLRNNKQTKLNTTRKTNKAKQTQTTTTNKKQRYSNMSRCNTACARVMQPVTMQYGMRWKQLPKHTKKEEEQTQQKHKYVNGHNTVRHALGTTETNTAKTNTNNRKTQIMQKVTMQYGIRWGYAKGHNAIRHALGTTEKNTNKTKESKNKQTTGKTNTNIKRKTQRTQNKQNKKKQTNKKHTNTKGFVKMSQCNTACV